jgi:hypothetical protein
MKPSKRIDFVMEAWPKLTLFQRIRIVRTFWLYTHPLVRAPVVVSLFASLISVGLLIILPIHPISISTAIGGGLAIGLLVTG